MNAEPTTTIPDCPNCLQPHRVGNLPDLCVFAALLACLESRLERPLTQAEIEGAYTFADVPALWNALLGPAVDELQGYVAQHHNNTPTPCLTCGTDTVSDEVYFNTDGVVRCDVCGTVRPEPEVAA